VLLGQGYAKFILIFKKLPLYLKKLNIKKLLNNKGAILLTDCDFSHNLNNQIVRSTERWLKISADLKRKYRQLPSAPSA
jgi:5S rRNA maturation endonuclease (ribonuclease M5)